MAKGLVAASSLAVGLLAGLPARASVIYTSRSSTVSQQSTITANEVTVRMSADKH